MRQIEEVRKIKEVRKIGKKQKIEKLREGLWDEQIIEKLDSKKEVKTGKGGKEKDTERESDTSKD